MFRIVDEVTFCAESALSLVRSGIWRWRWRGRWTWLRLVGADVNCSMLLARRRWGRDGGLEVLYLQALFYRATMGPICCKREILPRDVCERVTSGSSWCAMKYVESNTRYMQKWLSALLRWHVIRASVRIYKRLSIWRKDVTALDSKWKTQQENIVETTQQEIQFISPILSIVIDFAQYRSILDEMKWKR